MMKKIDFWFSCDNETDQKHQIAPEPQNLLNKMMNAAITNSLRPRQGYRYNNDLKSFCVYNRILSGPMAFKTLHLNLKGCFPSISTTNRYIHRADYAIIEGDLRVNKLLNYLNERKQPLWVCLSEDATRLENRLQYDSSTNQIVGFVLPVGQYGIPVPLFFKARTGDEILSHFLKNIPVANFVNTVIATPLGGAPSFCLLVFGSNCRYTAKDVANRWECITKELNKFGIGVFTISSDSEPKFNSAMRKNSGLGKDSNDLSRLFKCGKNFNPPFFSKTIPMYQLKCAIAF